MRHGITCFYSIYLCGTLGWHVTKDVGESGAVTSALGLRGGRGLCIYPCLGEQKYVYLGAKAGDQRVRRIAVVLDTHSGVLALVHSPDI